MADATADSAIFSCKMSRDAMAKFAHGGKNSQVFLELINSRPQRSEARQLILADIQDARRTTPSPSGSFW